METTKYSISKVAKVTGKSRATIRKHLDAGDLSFEKNAKGHRVMDASEVARFFGSECNFKVAEEPRKQNVAPNNETTTDVQVLLEELLNASKWEREQSQARIARLEKDFDDAKVDYKQTVRLLEDRSSKANDWEKAIAAMEEKLSNQEDVRLRELEERHKKQIHRMKQELNAERSKPFLKRLLGVKA